MAKSSNSTSRAVSRAARKDAVNPRWFLPLMLGFMIVGFVWIILFYVSMHTLPIPGIGFLNVAIGFAIMFIGFIMATRWK
ncbi:MAG: cell division protein CrgA [Agrococcus casei]|uniref:cell division protein CrgA n=1 Tax=Agrococcus casei TaxID=343512 RepID=UPI003F9126CD